MFLIIFSGAKEKNFMLHYEVGKKLYKVKYEYKINPTAFDILYISTNVCKKC